MPENNVTQGAIQIEHSFKSEYTRERTRELLDGGYELVMNPQVMQALVAESLFFIKMPQTAPAPVEVTAEVHSTEEAPVEEHKLLHFPPGARAVEAVASEPVPVG